MDKNNVQVKDTKQFKSAANKEPKLGRKIESPQDKTVLRNLPVDKPVWAAYANMARQNIYQTLCHISHVIGKEVDRNNPALEENLLGIPAISILSPKSKAKAEVQSKAIKMLEKHFPFLNPMVEKLIRMKGGKNLDKTPALYYEVFECILPLINLLRNYYSHHILISQRINAKGRLTDEKLIASSDKLVMMLDYCMTGARRIVKERFPVDDKSKENKSGFTKADYDFFEGPNRYFDYIKVNSEDFAILDDKNRPQKVKREKNSYIYKVGITNDKERTWRLTNMGIYLLLTLFLTKKYAKEFGDKIDFWGKSFKKNPVPDNVVSLIHEISCVYRMHLPKDRIQSEKDKQAVGLDMLNELKKCPRELFETLSVVDQEKFRVETDAKEDSDGNKVLMLRSFDRFPVLALQYLDQMKMFDKIRFQVKLGEYRYKFYQKQNWLDEGEEGSDDRVRRLQKTMMGYGRLEEIEQQRKERWAGLIRGKDDVRADTFDTAPYITEHYASYNIENNHIALQWNTKGKGILDKSNIFMPSTELADGTTVAECHAPKCWLSVYDLPAVCFLTLLTGSGKRAEDLIVGTTEKYLDFFRALGSGEIVPYDKETKKSLIPENAKQQIIRKRKAGEPYNYVIEPYGIDIADLPRKVQDYILGDSMRANGTARFQKLAAERLQKMLEDSEKKIKMMELKRTLYAGKDNKLGKRSHEDIRQGSLACILAKDMVLFKKADENGKLVLTSQNFDILQKELALFSKTLSELTKIFINAQLIGCKDSKDNHPFLQSVVDSNPSGFVDFFICYMNKRKKYLEQCIRNKNYGELHFLHPDRAKWQNRNKDYYRELMSRYTAIELPGNLFLDAIVEELRKLNPESLKKPEVLDDALGRERKNAAFLIKAYMQAVGEGYQPYYGYKRGYKYFSMTYNPRWDFSTPIAKLEPRYLTVMEMDDFIKGSTAADREKKYIAALEDLKTQKINILKRKGRYDKGKERKLDEELNEAIEAADDKLRHSLKFYKENEKAIRRQKVQDALLFLMAKDVLSHTMEDADLSAYSLRYIGKDNASDILSMQLPFAVKLHIKTDSGVKEVTVRQGDLKLKNYGDFFRFIYDSRIQPLLAQVSENEIDRAELEKELDNYDMNRVPLFQYVHDLESRVCGSLSDDQLRSPKDESGKQVKVDFKYLLEFVNLKDSNKELLRVIRNAFCHSTYPAGTKVSIVFDKAPEKRSIPEVAKTLVTEFKSRSKGTTLKQTAAGTTPKA